MLKEEKLKSFRDIEDKLVKESQEFKYIYSHDVTLELENEGRPIEAVWKPFTIRVQKNKEEGLENQLLLQVIYQGQIISEQAINSTIDSFRLALADLLDLYLALKEFFDD